MVKKIELLPRVLGQRVLCRNEGLHECGKSGEVRVGKAASRRWEKPSLMTSAQSTGAGREVELTEMLENLPHWSP